jgi:hypothetical protein
VFKGLPVRRPLFPRTKLRRCLRRSTLLP